eukprot:COSAG02_NODE_759_length_17490_cov_29.152608_6_plen_59_part_00
MRDNLGHFVWGGRDSGSDFHSVALTKKKDSVLVELLVHGIVKEGPSPTNFCELSFHRL